jgi:hypothetical protein
VTARPWRCKPGCESMNEPRKRKCQACGRARPKRRRPAHLKALELPYEAYVVLNGGREVCGICEAPPKARRLHRDHDHRTGRPRALLCFRCNAALRPYMTLEWLERAAAYLRKADAA